MNSVDLIGNVTRDPQVRVTKTGKAVSSFTVACNRKFGDKESTDFVNCVAWGVLAESVGNQVKKGTRVYVHGRYTTRSYEDSNGNKRYVSEVVADIVALVLNSARKNNGSEESFYSMGTVSNDEKIPF
jgi:single-strand DNA-binding protein